MKRMKAYLNVGKLRLNMLLRREAIKNYPVKAYIEPTLFCNLRCPACPTGLQLGLRPSASMNVDVFKSAIDEVGDYLFQLWMYNWGEPLLHKQTPEMIRYAKDKGVGNIRLSTNLSIPLTDEYIDRFVRSGLDELIVSLDGTTQETYSKYRVRGEIDLVRANMLRIQEAKTRLGLSTPSIIWQFLVFKHNEEEIGRARAQHREWGADSIFFYGAEMPFEEYAQGFEPSSIPEFNQYHPDHELQQELKRSKKSKTPCSWLYGVFVLNPSGKVSSCCSVVAEGDDFAEYSPQHGFFRAWNSPRFKQARGLFTNHKSKKSKPKNGGVPPNGNYKSEKTGPPAKRSSLPIFNARQSNESEDRIICQSCPIPYRMNEAVEVINSTVLKLWHEFQREHSLKPKLSLLMAYLLMGAPNRKKYLRGFLTFGTMSSRVLARTVAHRLLHSAPRPR